MIEPTTILVVEEFKNCKNRFFDVTRKEFEKFAHVLYEEHKEELIRFVDGFLSSKDDSIIYLEIVNATVEGHYQFGGLEIRFAAKFKVLLGNGTFSKQEYLPLTSINKYDNKTVATDERTNHLMYLCEMFSLCGLMYSDFVWVKMKE